LLTERSFSIIINQIIQGIHYMKANIQERLNQFHSNLENIRAEHPRPESVTNFSFTNNDDSSMYYDEFIESLKETLDSSGPSSDKMNAISESILAKFEELKSVIDEAQAQQSKEMAAYQGDILRKQEEEQFLEFLKKEVQPLGFDSVLRVGKLSVPEEVSASFPKVYEAIGFTHIDKEERRDFVFFDSRKYDGKITHIFESKYRELNCPRFSNLTGYMQIQKLPESIDKYLQILNSEI
jgi:sugar-specific transcriptional regulator TrmB